MIAEALDAIFDVFADSSVADVAAGNIELLVHLEKVVPVLKSRVSVVQYDCYRQTTSLVELCYGVQWSHILYKLLLFRCR